MKAIVLTNGCPENRIDGARTEQFLIQNGWEITRDTKRADLIIFNACGLTESSQESSILIIKKLDKEKLTGSKLIVCGCLPRINKKRVKQIHHGDIIEGEDITKLSKVLEINNISKKVCANYLTEFVNHESSLKDKIIQNLLKIKDPSALNILLNKITKRKIIAKYRKLWKTANIVQPNTSYIKISSGCSNSCSYCAVKISRGNTASKPIVEVKKEFIEGLKLGYKKFSLIGTDNGSYGHDIGTNLVMLLTEMVSINEDFLINIRNVNPNFIIKKLPELLAIFRSGKIAHLTTAVQHGNNRILKLMNRGYTIEDFKFSIKEINKINPNLKIRTQIMVGFPGETKKEFNDCMKLIDEIKFDFVEIYQYSPRPGTAAYEMKNNITKSECHRRYFELLKMATNQH